LLNKLKILRKAAIALLHLFHMHLAATVIFHKPKSAKILVFDECGLEILEPIFGSEPFEVVHIRGERLYITPIIAWMTAKNILKLRHPFSSYILALVQCIRPSIVVTFIDNNTLLGTIAQFYPSSHYLAIQNGMRCLARDNPAGTQPIRHQYFACFGQHEIDMYTEHGAEVSKYFPFGSLRNAYYTEKKFAGNMRSYDICLVSEAEENLASHYPELEIAIRKLAGFVSKFCEETGCSVCITARNNRRDNPKGYEFESIWYQTYMHNKVELIENFREEFTTYQQIDSCGISLSLYSTALFEAFGRGQKVLFCNFTGNLNYDLPESGIWSLGNTDYLCFKERLLYLLEMKDCEFVRISEHAAKYVMNYGHNQSPKDFLRLLIHDAVCEPLY
jgi:surface carbohydrate biosynthesis protein